MNFLTTNFEDPMDIYFTRNFRLMDLPLEIIMKILIFLDDPDLYSLSKTCKYFQKVSNERYIMRSKFLYTKDRIGISLKERPTLKLLQARHIVPITNMASFNYNQYNISTSLEKSLKKETLNKNLSKRPDIQELHKKNIIQYKNAYINAKLKEFKKESISQVLRTLMMSYKFKTSTQKAQPQMKSGLEYPSIEIETSASKVEKSRTKEVTDEFTKIYQNFCKRLDKLRLSNKNKRSIAEAVILQNYTMPQDILNHIVDKKSNVPNISSKENNSDDVNVSSGKVRIKKRYFENLQNELQSNGVFKKAPEERKPSRTVLKASVINENKISYEKVF